MLQSAPRGWLWGTTIVSIVWMFLMAIVSAFYGIYGRLIAATYVVFAVLTIVFINRFRDSIGRAAKTIGNAATTVREIPSLLAGVVGVMLLSVLVGLLYGGIIAAIWLAPQRGTTLAAGPTLLTYIHCSEIYSWNN